MREEGDNLVERGYWQNPPNWPTHKGSEALWEELGRTVATFGMLEDTLARAQFAVTGQQQQVEGVELERQMQTWASELIKGLIEPLKPLGGKLAAAWKAADGELTDGHRAIANEIRVLADERNRLCHGAWIAFEQPDQGTVRYFARKFDVGGVYLETRSVQDLAEIRGRVKAVIEDVIADTEARTNRPFPGRGNLRPEPA